MKLKVFIATILLMALFFIIYNFDSEDGRLIEINFFNKSDEIIEEVVSLEDFVSLSSSVEEYSLIMSSVPGLPIDITAHEINDNYLMNVKLTNGTFLRWEDDYSITDLGSKIYLELVDDTIYWSPSEDKRGSDIIIKLVNKTTNNLVATDSYNIIEVNNYYTLLKLTFD